MERPPFAPAPNPGHGAWAGVQSAEGKDAGVAVRRPTPVAHAAPVPNRIRLSELDSQLHCSIIGTCLSTAELRKLMLADGARTGATDLEIHHEAVRLAGSDAGVEHLPLPSDDPKQRRPDISIARERLGWEPVVELRQGLELTIPYFAAQLDPTG